MSGSTTAQPLEYENLGYNAPDGMQIGRTTSDAFSFLGTAPTTGSTIVSNFAITTGAVSTSPFGFTTSTQANAISAAVAELKRKGFIL